MAELRNYVVKKTDQSENKQVKNIEVLWRHLVQTNQDLPANICFLRIKRNSNKSLSLTCIIRIADNQNSLPEMFFVVFFEFSTA